MAFATVALFSTPDHTTREASSIPSSARRGRQGSAPNSRSAARSLPAQGGRRGDVRSLLP
ncbi:hypothetical protein PGTUg99_022515 [Puccinia graminis f. sp. tritici]|uniref:Uncharacterized protein n=1 Tax=Puccinia graminis f. sp. tritici TaxID=56615 RepID=A0A5B0SJ83_PUCGR|nr:hypothetical protein PGTUg99_022515 [Puccinia graminis f. sp. tritici]